MENSIRMTGATVIFLPPRRAPVRRIRRQESARRLAATGLARLHHGFTSGSLALALTLAGCIVSMALILVVGIALEGWGAPL
jgi:hypothetical protein